MSGVSACRAAALLLAAATTVGCGKARTPQPATEVEAARPAKPAATAPEADDPWRSDRFCVRALEVSQGTPVTRRLPGLAIDAALARDALATVPVVTGVQGVKGADCKRRPRAEQVGVALALDYAASDSEPELTRPDKAGEGAELLVSAVAHVERAGPKGRPEVGRSTVEAAGPLVKVEGDALKRRVRARVVRAAAMATRRALGQLWARHQAEATLRDALGKRDPWRLTAAMQELGERGDTAAIDKIEAAARSTVADVAVVACATLGRLGQARSVPLLRAQLGAGRSPELAHAALFALHDIGGAEAWRAIGAAAKGHPIRWIRLRAKALLDARGGRP